MDSGHRPVFTRSAKPAGMLSWAFDWRGDGRRTVPDNRSDFPATGEAEERKTSGGGPATVTIAYIAESAGVSVPTVSKVLNGRQDLSVRPETRRRIHEAAEALGYRPVSYTHLTLPTILLV